jgi:hypothetical protein
VATAASADPVRVVHRKFSKNSQIAFFYFSSKCLGDSSSARSLRADRSRTLDDTTTINRIRLKNMTIFLLFTVYRIKFSNGTWERSTTRHNTNNRHTHGGRERGTDEKHARTTAAGRPVGNGNATHTFRPIPAQRSATAVVTVAPLSVGVVGSTRVVVGGRPIARDIVVIVIIKLLLLLLYRGIAAPRMSCGAAYIYILVDGVARGWRRNRSGANVDVGGTRGPID